MKKSVQLFKVQINLNEKIIFSFQKVFGVGYYVAQHVCKKFGFSRNSLVSNIPLGVLNIIEKYIRNNCLIQDFLKKKVFTDLKELRDMKSVRGFRHRLHLPVRGQRTRSNHKTQKRLKS